LPKSSKYLLFFLVLFQLNSLGQNRIIDSLKLVLKNAKHDTTRCEVYVSLGRQYYLEEPDSALVFWQKAQFLAEKNLPSVGSLRMCYLKILGSALGNIGIIYKAQGNISKALEFNHKSLNIRKEIGDKLGIANSLNNIGVIYQNQGDIPKALDYYHRSLKIYEEIGDKQGIANSLNNIGDIYQSQGSISKALEYNQKSLKIRGEIGDKKGLAMSLNNIGNIYYISGDITKTLEYYHQSLKIREEIGYKQGIAYSLYNIGGIHQNQGEIQKALEYYLKSLKIREEIGDKSGIANSLNNIGIIYFGQNNLIEGFNYANRSMKLAKELGYPEIIKTSAELLKQIYQKQHKYKEAFEMYELEITMRDSINNEETQKAAVKKQMQYQYETQARELQNEQEKKDIREQEEREKQKVITNSVLAVLVLVLVLAIFMFRSNRQKQKANEIITQQKALVEHQKLEVEEQKNLIEEKHKEITDSINYAERIQRSFLASREHLNASLSDYFIMFKPKDVVSGDFYWSSTLNNGSFILATADSTGHGVPGAIMSLLNITSLEKAIETETEPSAILNVTREIIIDRLKRDGSLEGGKDGMDCSLCVYDKKKNKLIVTAANNPVWIVRGTDVMEVKVDKIPVGKHDRQKVSFSQQEYDLQKGDVVYTLTDGYPDQFGGIKGKKFMSKNLRELLAKNAQLRMTEQKEILETTFKNWVGNLEQVDDVTVIGFRV
jgi:serine phosphatase RsbU (regulator of sigma subunit)